MVKAKDIAAMANVSLQTVLKWARENKIPHHRISSRCLRFSLEEVNHWLKLKRDAQNKQPSQGV
jgi:excisionase family DNA binding protein